MAEPQFNSNLKIIIPAAGYGRRVSDPSAPNRSKELIINPQTGRPLIDKALGLAAQLRVPSVVITREEKTDLIDYIHNWSKAHGQQQCGGGPQAPIELQIIQPSREWPDTILQSESRWGEGNILILPDTDYSPTEIVRELAGAIGFATEPALKNTSAHECDIAAATFHLPFADIKSLATFGCFAQTSQGEWWHAEKPQQTPANLLKPQPWGLLAWRKEYGRPLFEQMLTSTFDHEWRCLPSVNRRATRFAHFHLDKFTDLTRGWRGE